MRSRTGRSAFEARYFTRVWPSGLIWHLTRWGGAFLGTFLINEMTGSPRLVQLAGTALYGPLLLGGMVSGMVADRVDRLLTVRVQLAMLIPASVVIGVLVRADRAPVWALYLYMFVVGIGWVTDMTSRRALVFDLVGGERIDSAMAMESLSLSLGIGQGPQLRAAGPTGHAPLPGQHHGQDGRRRGQGRERQGEAQHRAGRRTGRMDGEARGRSAFMSRR